MWGWQAESLDDGRIRRLVLESDDESLSYADVIDLWRHDHGFREFFDALLAAAPYPAFLWETRPVTAATSAQPFEFVLVDCPPLAGVNPDPETFANQFASAGDLSGIATFQSLGGDAVLVAPCPRGPLAAYPHLAAFARGAPNDQRHALWRAVGAACADRLGVEPHWVSTSGLGVAWLHVRLDSRPKYYSFRPYRDLRPS